MEIKDFLTLQTYSQWRQSIVVIPGSNLQIKIFGRSAHISCSTQKIPWDIPYVYNPRNFFTFRMTSVSQPATKSMHYNYKWAHRLRYMQKNHRDVPCAYSPHDFFTLRATSASNLQINFSGSLRTYLMPHAKEFLGHTIHVQSPELFYILHSAWPLYLSLPRNQCMIMINKRIACPEISKGFIERTLRVQSRWCFTLCVASASQSGSNFQINFSGSLHTYLMLQAKEFLEHAICSIRLPTQISILISPFGIFLTTHNQ